MRHTTVLLLLAIALPARGEQPDQLERSVVHVLTPIDTLPTKEDLLVLFPQNTADELAMIAQTHTDFGVRLRAIRALPQFCPAACAGTTPHATLVAILGTLKTDPPPEPGRAILLLRATIESLGVTRSGDPDDVSLLVPYLDHPSRDIRAATAFALRDLCDQQAVTYLRNRYNVEMQDTGVAQVRLAISAALRDLGTCSN